MSMLKEFREFAVKGNVMDLAVGVIIGAAFGKIVDSMVDDLIMPIIGRDTGGLDFSNSFLALIGSRQRHAGPRFDALKKVGCRSSPMATSSPSLNFVILAWVIFLIVKRSTGSEARGPAAADAPPAPPEDVSCCARSATR